VSGRVRDVLLTGGQVTDNGATYQVSPAQALIPRLLAVLAGLSSQASNGVNWQNFLSRSPVSNDDYGAIEWGNIVIGGFSMGAGEWELALSLYLSLSPIRPEDSVS
jgi:hypothetical protein